MQIVTTGMGSTNSCLSVGQASSNEQNIKIQEVAVSDQAAEVDDERIQIHDSPCDADDEGP